MALSPGKEVSQDPKDDWKGVEIISHGAHNSKQTQYKNTTTTKQSVLKMKLTVTTAAIVLVGLVGSVNGDGRVLRGSASMAGNKGTISTVDDTVADVEDALHRLMQANGADVVGCITITSPDGTSTVRTVAPCDPNAAQPSAPTTGESSGSNSDSDDRRLKSNVEGADITN